MKFDLTVTEAKEIINHLSSPESFLKILKFDVQTAVGDYLSSLMKVELAEHLGRDKYERKEGNSNYRNGQYSRTFALKGIGEVQVSVPRDRNSSFQPQVLPKSKRYEAGLVEDLSLLFLSGVSTRSLSMISQRLIGRKISPTEISNATRELTDAVENWRLRDLSQEQVKYIYLDGVNFKMRLSEGISLVPVLAAIGVLEDGNKIVLSLQSGDKESATSWREFFKDLKKRGLKSKDVQLGIMDGLAGLEKVFQEEFTNAKIQRCQVHVARNVITKVPKKLKQEVADDLRSIFYASSKKKAYSFYERFVEKWQKEVPSAVKSLSGSIMACLCFFRCPEEEWISLRTTNIIERLNKEFKRRTKPMEIVPGEEACYRLLAFISLKMELHWRANPVGKVKKNLPFFNEIKEM